MIPVLIVGYLRPENMAKILDSVSKDRRTYVFIDHSSTDPKKNDEVYLTALKYEDTHLINIRRSESNLGVGQSVPEAISWVFEKEASVIILEDDCIPNEFMFDYFDENVNLLDFKNIILSARAPLFTNGFVMLKNGKSTYPLTNAWAIRKESWVEFVSSRNSLIPINEFLRGILVNPKLILSLSYFFAATIRARNGLLKAWDVEMSMYFLSRRKFCLLPNHSCVTILGVDSVASNTKIEQNSDSDLYLAASRVKPSSEWDFSKSFQRTIESQIERNTYQIKIRHILSPMKSIILLLVKVLYTKL